MHFLGSYIEEFDSETIEVYGCFFRTKDSVGSVVLNFFHKSLECGRREETCAESSERWITTVRSKSLRVVEFLKRIPRHLVEA